MATTYVYGRFEKIIVTDQVPTAVTMVGRRSGRISIAVSPNFVKRCIISSQAQRKDRKFRGIKSRADEFGRCMTISNEAVLAMAKENALLNIMRHEFGHIFFGHLENTSPEDAFLSNLVQDSLLNYHLGVNLGLVTMDRMGSKGLLVDALTDIRWASHLVEANRGYYREPPKWDVEDVDDWKYSPHMDQEKYLIWRIWHTFVRFLGKGRGVAHLRKFILKYVAGVINYTEDYSSLVNMVQDTFPILKEMSDQNKLHQHDPVSVTMEDEEYRPATKADIPPIVTDLMGDILQQAGLGGEVAERILKDIQEIRLSKATIKSLLTHATKSLLGVSKKVLKLEITRDKRARTIIPNKRPIVSDLLLESSLLLERQPKYIPLRAKMSTNVLWKKVFLFIDVSGSMMGVWDKLLAFCRALSRECELKLFQFSTVVEEVTARELQDGVLKTSGGTDVTPVTEKIRELSRLSDAFIIIGDRYYSGPKEIDSPASPLRLLDVCYDGGSKGKKWFKSSRMCEVHSVWLDENFEVHGDTE